MTEVITATGEKRLIKIASVRTSQVFRIESDAKTWGELRPAMKAAGIDLTNMVATIKASHHTIEHDEGVLPEGPCTIYLLAAKQKAGAIDFANITILADSVNGICEDLESAQKSIGKIITTGKAFASAATTFGNTMVEASDNISRMQNAVDRLIGSPVLGKTLVAAPEARKAATKALAKEEKIKKIPPQKTTPVVKTKETPVVKAKDPTDAEVEKMKIKAQKLGLKIHMKVAKSDSSYNRLYKKRFDAAKLEGVPIVKESKKSGIAAATIVESVKQSKQQKAQIPIADDDDDDAALLREAKEAERTRLKH